MKETKRERRKILIQREKERDVGGEKDSNVKRERYIDSNRKLEKW